MTATPAAPAARQSAALDASIPPIATTGMDTASQIAASPSSPIGGSASGFDRRRPHGTGADVGGADPLPRDRLLDGRRRRAEHQSGLDRSLGSLVVAAQVHAVGAELDGSLAVVVDDEGDAVQRAKVAKRPAFVHDLLGGLALQAQLKNGCASFDGDLRRLQVTDQRVQLHNRVTVPLRGQSPVQKCDVSSTRALPSIVSGFRL